MKGIQILLLIAASVLTAANPTANYEAVSISSVTETFPVKEIPKTKSECVPFSRPADCEEVRLNGNTASGVYTIWPRSRKAACKSMEVYCDMTVDGGGWTVLQRRGQYGNADNYFHKTWEIYKHGFGELEREFWLGNDKIHVLSNQESYSVRFDMRLVNGTSAYAMYDQFWIEDEERKYQLNIAGYSGDAGDSMSAVHNSMKFSTLDSKNDKSSEHCAATRTGGWWFNNCLKSNLNGLSKQGNGLPYSTGIVWELFSGFKQSLEFSEIKIKPRYFR